MKARWSFSILITILTVLGTICQQQISVPNQEIVLQFSNIEIHSDQAQTTITTVKEQLETLGVSEIQIIEGEDGNLKIVYYSTTDSASIKNALTKLSDTKSSQFPSDKNPVTYDFDVFDIQIASSSDWDFEGTFVLEQKLGSDRLFNPIAFATFIEDDLYHSNYKEIHKVTRYINVTKDHIPYIIPEVRAGPKA